MKKKFIVVAYYTKNTGYEKEIKNLEASLRKFNFTFNLRGIYNLGSWSKNTNYKPHFCKEMLKVHKCPILYLDADAEVKQYPALLDNLKRKCDIAVHYRNGKELLTGTLYFSNTFNARKIINEWILEVEKYPDIWEQKNLAKVLERLKGQIKIFELPPRYCQIFDLMKNVGDPVILHHQASRRLKGEVNAK